jgi:hypothetical protein
MVNIEVIGYLADVINDDIKKALRGIKGYRISIFPHSHSCLEGCGNDETYIRIVYEKKDVDSELLYKIVVKLGQTEMTSVRIEYHPIPLSQDRPDANALAEIIYRTKR